MSSFEARDASMSGVSTLFFSLTSRATKDENAAL